MIAGFAGFPAGTWVHPGSAQVWFSRRDSRHRTPTGALCEVLPQPEKTKTERFFEGSLAFSANQKRNRKRKFIMLKCLNHLFEYSSKFGVRPPTPVLPPSARPSACPPPSARFDFLGGLPSPQLRRAEVRQIQADPEDGGRGGCVFIWTEHFD